MRMFRPVPNKVDFVAQEHEILDLWRKTRAFEKLRALRTNGPPWSFIDGPITANNPMGVHHAWGRTYKDLFQRYRSMRGYHLRYQNGFDAQGLWVEVNVEKDLGFGSKREIEDYGLEAFVNACKRRVLTYAAIQTEQSIRLGYWMDWDDTGKLRFLEERMKEDPSQMITIQGPGGAVSGSVEGIVGRLGQPELGGSYFTFSDENNYTIWAMLKKCHERGWVYKGTDVMPWCTRCGTGLSQHEIVTEGYQELTHRSVFLRFPLRGRPGESLLVWTTTPWTLTSNVAAAVNPDLAYALVAQDGNKFWLSKGALPNAVRGAHQVLEERPGRELVGWNYDGPFDELPVVQANGAKDAHTVIAWGDVDESEGTGIVHIAPGCGSEDFRLGREHSLPVLAPLDEAGSFGAGFGPLAGRNVHALASGIFESLASKGLLHRLEDYTHRYPVCWRCQEELVFRLVDEWYISMGASLDKPWELVREEEKQGNLRYQMMDVVLRETRWYPGFGLDRELDWLRNMQDWMISKKRYWGLALPIWECRDCGGFDVIGSREELLERSVEGWEEFLGHSPHRPWVDSVMIACPACGARARRVPDVGNPWLDAGIVAMSTLQYRTNRDVWRKWFPADLISESFPGQFRNWFYSLIAMSTVMERRAPFKNVFSYGTLLAEDGREMHKSLGNAIWFDEAAEKMGVDVMRWMYSSSRPEQNLLFGYEKADDVRRRVLLPLWNIYSFFVTYANLDKWVPEMEDTQPGKPSLLDRWVLSQLQTLILEVTGRLEGYDPVSACAALESYLDDLSNWYVRRSRRRFWRSEVDADKQAAHATLYRVLVTLSQLVAPFMPFVVEAIYQNLARREGEAGVPESVHLTDWPGVEEARIDKGLEADMALVRRIVNAARSARAAHNLKVRQPLRRLLIHAPAGDGMPAAGLSEELSALIAEEVNVKSVLFLADHDKLVSYHILPNLKILGPKLGRKLQFVSQALGSTDALELVRRVQTGLPVRLTLSDGQAVELAPEEIVIRKQEPEGFAVSTDEDVTVAIDTEITPELAAEGLAREVVRRIQELRKTAGFELDDRIETTYETDDELHRAIESMAELIAGETLSRRLSRESPAPGAAVARDTVLGHVLEIGVRRA